MAHKLATRRRFWAFNCPNLSGACPVGHSGGRPMRIDVFTVLPQILEPALSGGLLGKARERGVVDVRVHDLRDHATDRHRSVDDSPFGGGPGMVLSPEPVFAAVEAVRAAPAAVPPRPRRAPVRPGPGRRAGRRRRLLAAVRALRGGRRAGAPPPGRRRAVDRRLRAGRRGGGRLRGDRGRHPPGAGRHGQRRRRPATSPSRRACSSTPTTPGRPSSGAGPSPRSCARATTAASPAGGTPRPWPAPGRAGPI